MTRGMNIGQGIDTITDPETGRVYPIQAGGSTDAVEAATAALAGQGGDDAQPQGIEETQPEAPATTDDGGGDKGQDLIEPFLEGLEGEQRDLVAKRLEQARSKWDSSANQKIQSLSEQLKGFQQFTDDPDELKPVVDLYAYIMQQPDEALPWVIEELETTYGVEGLSRKVADSLGITEGQQRADVPGGVQGSQAQQTGTNGQQASPDKPLTRADLEEFTREQQQKQQAEAERQRKQQEAASKLDSWTTDALEKFDLSERIGPEHPMRKFIFQQAHQLMQQGEIRNGQVAIETAVEQVKQFLDSQDPTSGSGANQNGSGQREPRTANAGQGINKPDDFDPNDKKDRVNLAAQLLEAASSEE